MVPEIHCRMTRAACSVSSSVGCHEGRIRNPELWHHERLAVVIEEEEFFVCWVACGGEIQMTKWLACAQC
jgi:hypothetical protein